MANQEQLQQYALRMGDTATVLSHRYCELIGKAPMLEEEIALGNIGLDLIGQATTWLEYTAELANDGRSADDFAYLRGEREYTNYLLAELDNGDFAQTILRGFLMSSFLYELYTLMQDSKVEHLAAIAGKAVKEVRYHITHQGDWIERLGQGTEESHRRLKEALDYLWPYTQELFENDELEKALAKAGAVPAKETLEKLWTQRVSAALQRGGLSLPEPQKYHQTGGLKGVHTEALGYILAEMQSVVRAHPGAKW